MTRITQVKFVVLVTVVLLGMLGYFVRDTSAHCDTMDGPVVNDARTAIANKNIDPVLKWVRREDEAAIRAVFEQTLAVRGASDAARDLADRFFFETVVRVHRATEGEPYTGLKPAGTPVEPGIHLADEALDQGNDKALIADVTAIVEKGLHERFQTARDAKQHADESAEAGRAFVKAYVEYTHYVAGLVQIAEGHAAHSEHSSAAPTAHHGE